MVIFGSFFILECAFPMVWVQKEGRCVALSGDTRVSCTPNNLWRSICQCVTGYRLESSTFQCQKCFTTSCLSCENVATICTLCDFGLTLVNAQCLRYCNQACLTCTRPDDYTSCLSCRSGYYLYLTSCLSACPSGTYANRNTGTCEPCSVQCATCVRRPEVCLACKNNYFSQPVSLYIDGLTCLAYCPNGYYKDTFSRACAACNQACAVCTDSSNFCPSCSSNALSTFDGKCVYQCPIGYYQAGNKCLKCSSTCYTCAYGENYCLQCTDFTMTAVYGLCVKCDKTCKSCVGSGALDCTSCFGGSVLSKGRCIPLICSDGFFPNSLTSKCDKCPSTCAKCNSLTECTLCNDGFIILQSECVPCERKKGLVTINGVCIEVCGDGINLKWNECDDGNLIDNDGCDATCNVQTGWRCTGGSEVSADKCNKLSTVSIEPLSQASLDSTNVYLNFSEPVFMNGLWSDTLRVVKLPSLELFTDFKVTKISDNSYIINFNLQNMAAGAQQNFKILVAKPANLVDQNGNSISLPELTIRINNPGRIDDGSSGKSSVGLTSATLAFGSTGITLLLSGSFGLIWKLLDTLQVISYLVLISVEYPELLNSLFNWLTMANLSWAPNPFLMTIEGLGVDYSNKDELPPKFEEKGYDSNILVTSGQYITLMLIFIFAHIISIKFKERITRYRYLNKVFKIFQSNIVIMLALNLYFPTLVCNLLQIQHLKFDSAFNAVSAIIGIALMGLILFTPVIIFEAIKRKKTFLHKLEIKQKFGCLYEEYHYNRFWARNYSVIQTSGKLAYGLSLTLFYSFPALQVCVILGVKIFETVAGYKIRPYKNKWDNYMEIANEGLTSLALFMILGLVIKKEPNNMFGVGLSIFVIILVGVNSIIALYQQLKIYANGIKYLIESRKTKNLMKLKSSNNLLAFSVAGRSAVLKRNDIKGSTVKGRQLKRLNHGLRDSKLK